LPGLENYLDSVRPILSLVDGIIASPGQARRLVGRNKSEASLLVRADWTNALRSEDFVLPPETISHISLLSPADALDLGASALVLHFLLGYEETIEAGCLRLTVQLSLQGAQSGLPLIVDVQTRGPRVVLHNKAIELGASYALEGGADGVAVPWPGRSSLELILKMAAGTPVWIKPSALDSASQELSEALSIGAVGLWLDERVFAQPDSSARLAFLSQQIHQPAGAG
jgi:DhnA family fructose-bisphosphate aldolase class Ia